MSHCQDHTPDPNHPEPLGLAIVSEDDLPDHIHTRQRPGHPASDPHRTRRERAKAIRAWMATVDFTAGGDMAPANPDD